MPALRKVNVTRASVLRVIAAFAFFAARASEPTARIVWVLSRARSMCGAIRVVGRQVKVPV